MSLETLVTAGKPGPDEWVTAEELAAELKLPSVETLYSWRARRKGPAGVKIGRYLRYRRSAINAWLDGLR